MIYRKISMNTLLHKKLVFNPHIQKVFGCRENSDS